MLLGIGGATWGLAVATAIAAPQTVVVVPAQVEGDAPQLAAAIDAAVADAVGESGRVAATPPEGCAEVDCANASATDGRVVRGHARVLGSDFTLTVQLFDSAGTVVDERTDVCEICTQEEAAVAMGQLALASLNGAPLPTAERAEPAVNDPVAPVPAESTGAPVMVTTSTEPSSEVPRQPQDGASSPIRPQTLEAIGWGAVGVGAAAVVGGIVLLAIDGRSAKNNCDPPHVDVEGNCEFQWNTLGGGIALTVGGVVAAGGGAGLVIYARRQRGRTKQEVAVTTSAVTVRF